MVYTLSDFEGNVFYVGCTTQRLNKRLHGHFCETRSNRSNNKKNKKIKLLNYKVKIAPIDADLNKESFWVKKLRQEGADLTNSIATPFLNVPFRNSAIIGYWRGGAEIITISAITGEKYNKVEKIIQDHIAVRLAQQLKEMD